MELHGHPLANSVRGDDMTGTVHLGLGRIFLPTA